MCGRFTLTLDPAQLREAFPWLSVPDGLSPRYNVAPTQPVAVVPNTGENKIDTYTWGLIPSWSKDISIASRLINARAETITEKPAFRNSFRRRRCLILSDGFYEWKQDLAGKGKTPYYIRLQSGEPFAFAGLWDTWVHPDGSEIRSCTIITTSPNELMQPIHNRMPVILAPHGYAEWLESKEQKLEVLTRLLKPYPSSSMITFPVTKLVNYPQNDTPECVKPAIT
jgi:putative SOS response-associated peptidase YedK